MGAELRRRQRAFYLALLCCPLTRLQGLTPGHGVKCGVGVVLAVDEGLRAAARGYRGNNLTTELNREIFYYKRRELLRACKDAGCCARDQEAWGRRPQHVHQLRARSAAGALPSIRVTQPRAQKREARNLSAAEVKRSKARLEPSSAGSWLQPTVADVERTLHARRAPQRAACRRTRCRPRVRTRSYCAWHGWRSTHRRATWLAYELASDESF